MRFRHLILSTVVGVALPVQAWGTLGHETVALIAQKYVTSATKSFVQGILSNTSATYMADVATWADSYRYTAAGKFSAPFHYIDAEDSPPKSCGVDYTRDCGSGGCSVSAIGNYTTRLQNKRLSKANHLDALRFIIHIVGDIHQPLHDEALQTGGNGIAVTFGSASTNLHHIWDTEMPEKLVGGATISDAESWTNTLTAMIDSGAYKAQSANWLSNMDIGDPVKTALGWASEANGYVCSIVLPNGVPAVQGQQLDGAYYESTTATIELQIARAGYRLAAWLNLIATGSTGLSNLTMHRRSAEPLSWTPPAVNDHSRAKMARAASGHMC